VKSSSTWLWWFKRVVAKLWFRASLFSALAAASALLALLLEPLIPERWPALAGADAVDGILQILATSMLMVTIFSLTTMVSAYSAAASHVTPRATRLLLEDSTSQNALSTFLGAFLFSLVGIIALSTGLYGTSGRGVLFVATLVVIVVIVVTLLRWVFHLSTLGQVGDTIARVEKAATAVLDERIANPFLGGAPPQRLHPSSEPVHAASVGYVLHVDIEALSKVPEAAGTIHLAVLPGSFVHPSLPIAWIDTTDEEARQAVRHAFTIGRERSYDQDPRFGLVVLSEIASRALSPAVNDPGTAISVIGTAVRILDRCNEFGRRQAETEVVFPRVHVPALSIDDLFEDLFGPIARDGAAMLEVGIHLQKGLAMLAAAGDESTKRAARRHSTRALEQAQAALALESDRQRLAELASEVGRER